MSADKPQDSFFKIRCKSSGGFLARPWGLWTKNGKAYISRAAARGAFRTFSLNAYPCPKSDDFELVEFRTVQPATEPLQVVSRY